MRAGRYQSPLQWATVLALNRITRIAIDAARRQDTLLIERGIGYWITEGGDFVPTPPGVSHADVARQWFADETLSDDEHDAFERDANAFALARGWTRVRIYPSERIVYADYGAGREQPHRRRLEELLDRLGLVGYNVKYTDEDGNYVSS